MKLTVGFGKVGFSEVGFGEVGFSKVGFGEVGGHGAEQATAPTSGTACGRDTGFADGVFSVFTCNSTLIS